jgi:hypothetical protein
MLSIALVNMVYLHVITLYTHILKGGANSPVINATGLHVKLTWKRVNFTVRTEYFKEKMK